MTFLDEVEGAAATTQPGPKCGMGRFLAGRKPKEQSEINEALASAHPTAAIGRVLRRRWPDGAPSVYVLNRHRKGDCGCR